MSHEHLTYSEIIENFDGRTKPDKVSVQDLREQCTTCLPKITKIRYLFAYLKEKNYKPSEKVYNKLQDKAQDLELFYEFINDSRLAKKGTSFRKENNLKKKSKFVAFKRIINLCLVFAVVTFVLSTNFFYYKLVANKDFTVLTAEQLPHISITRKGLFFGSIPIKTNRLLLQKDIISVSNTFFMNTPAAQLHALNNSTFAFTEKYDTVLISLYQGEFFIDFPVEYSKKREILLLGSCRILFASSKIYVLLQNNNSSFVFVEGKAVFRVPYQREINIRANTYYSIEKTRNGILLLEKTIEPKDLDTILKKFKETKQANLNQTSSTENHEPRVVYNLPFYRSYPYYK